MSRSERLLDLIQILRRHRRPVSGRTLADEMGVSIRTLYRDIVSLQRQGAPIEGEAGLGYVLKPGFMLPPLMFSDEEIEAIVLGSRWVAKQPDKKLAAAATDALAKIAAVLPDDLREDLDATTLLVGPRSDNLEAIDLGVVRQAIREERKLGFLYRDAEGAASERLVWPFALAFFDKVRVMAAWCETRQDFRHFRADRMSDLTPTGVRYPRRRQAMLKEWRATLDAPRSNARKGDSA
ncbi:MAG: HTH domain-containing protein [Mesorhizobium sp.]|uniref:helix-turn-helix transcriptional regulator n=4 Tax=Mesorhizobium TaxID=68287 RepID=UPI000F75D353|nr:MULTISPECIES: YafY family protein [unclassified Mesorhizobium]RUY09379.1 HTH domain-containing protein [Mesorhizobium sp. M2A.F.Ca.ET.040.01.1.1]RVC66210.1 HTH domain-containing protein [Mesorhizobium sp. M00.F.Ca.ET.038.03.1.1]RVC77941.1 HTH domain-containing protein [Mesorhizobium sp. M2A.F.Ca.ET.046.02.1.1]AZO36697.1 YafY family transcriptional regulator [Mesorhizobium sp. M2A.F.Ca.ET.046.03.2.1]RWA92439.1 MAG: HTH domain-containing protein [Mesorhizobium sp.]